MKSINWGIIGLGNIAEKFANDIKSVDSAILFGVASRNKEKAEKFAEKHHAIKAFGSYEELASHPEIDAVYIATPHPFHAANTIHCLNHKKAVLCEKAFAMNENEAQLMLKAAKDNNVFLMEAFWTRFLPAFQKVKELIDAGEIGDIKLIHANFSFIAPYLLEKRLYNKKLGGGSLLDIGIYPVFLSLFFLGFPVEIKTMARFTETDVDETINILFKHSNGALSNLSSSIISDAGNTAEIIGTKGTIKMNERFHETKSISLLLNNEKEENFEFDYSENGYNFEIEEVNKCLNLGLKESPNLPQSFSLQLIQLLDKIREDAGIKY